MKPAIAPLLSPRGSLRLQGSDAALSQSLTTLGAYWTGNECYECTMSDSDALPRNRCIFLFRFHVQPGEQGFLISYRIINRFGFFEITLTLLLAALVLRACCYGESFLPVLFVLLFLILSVGNSLWQRYKCVHRFRSAFKR